MTRTITDDDGDSIALIVPEAEFVDGANFVTPNEFPLQLGLLSYDRDESAPAHSHPPRELGAVDHQELVHVVEGAVDIDLFDDDDDHLETVTLSAGDTAFFVAGGRGWTAAEDARLIEAKLGPFLGAEDKTEL